MTKNTLVVSVALATLTVWDSGVTAQKFVKHRAFYSWHPTNDSTRESDGAIC